MPREVGDTWAFIMHVVGHLEEGGRAVVATPRPAFGEGAKALRKELVNRNLLRAVVGLDSAVFEDVPTEKVILLFRKEECEATGEEILFYQTPDADYVQTERGGEGLKRNSAERIAEEVKSRVAEGDTGRVVPHDEIHRHEYALTPETYHRD